MMNLQELFHMGSTIRTQDVNTVINALRVAASLYQKDAIAVLPQNERLATQFDSQCRDALRIADELESEG
jgi:hypothetical protein